MGACNSAESRVSAYEEQHRGKHQVKRRAAEGHKTRCHEGSGYSFGGGGNCDGGRRYYKEFMRGRNVSDSDDGNFEGGGNCDGGRRYYKELMQTRNRSTVK